VSDKEQDDYTIGIIVKDGDGNLYGLKDTNKLPNIPDTLTPVMDPVKGPLEDVEDYISNLLYDNSEHEDVASKYICDRIK